jgi:hypothetical protein
MSNRTPVQTAIRRPLLGDVLDRDEGLLWEVAFIKDLGHGSATSNVERLTQGELIRLWQQIGVLFNLGGMRDAMGDKAESFVNPDR